MIRSLLRPLSLLGALLGVLALGGPAGAVCGDGVVDPGECCDDANQVAGDGCENDCTCTKKCCAAPNQVCTVDADCTPGDHCGQCAVDHLQCYRVTDPLRLQGPLPSWLDLSGQQFGTSQCRITGTFRLFCVPVTKTVSQPIQRRFLPPGGPFVPFTPAPLANTQRLTQDQLCYRIQCPTSQVIPEKRVIDQFALRKITKLTPYLLCGPAEKKPCGVPITQRIDTGTASPDPIWSLIAPAAVGTPGPAVVIPPNQFALAWDRLLAPDTTWVSPLFSCSQFLNPPPCPAKIYHYQTCWQQCDASGSVTLSLLADNDAKVYLNGQQIGATGANAYTLPAVTITHTGPPLVDGTNCLEVRVTNGTGGTGMDVQGSVTYRP
jgi:cysteine-rich repeat protein